MNTYVDFRAILKEIEFDRFYLSEVSNSNYRIDYGSRKGLLQFSSVKDAAKKYTYESTDTTNL